MSIIALLQVRAVVDRDVPSACALNPSLLREWRDCQPKLPFSFECVLIHKERLCVESR